MTETEAKYFKELHKQRKKLAEALNQPAARGAKDSVADQYSEQAHFIYELLQNADDAGATKVRFDLNLERLVFAHNGSRHFSISNPDTEDEDGKNGLLGDINAITSIGHSNKDVVSIGKFGVGFKSVFQYTDTPEIYDSNFAFKIEDFLVPVLLDEDYPDRRKKETVFVFPLRAKGKTSQELYDDISCKVNSLEWLINFYKWLSEKRTYIEGLENKPFYLDNEKKVSPIFDQKGNEELFLPIPGFSNYRMIHPQLLEDKNVERFLRDLGLSEPSRIDQIKKEILPLYKGYVAETDSNKHQQKSIRINGLISYLN